MDKAGFSPRVSYHFYWLFESRGICPRWAFNRKFCRWILHGTKQLSVLSNMTRAKGLVITILTCNLTSTPQGLDIAKDALITFCFTRVSCDIQIRQLINDIKCALADCIPLISHSATVINIRILLNATSYFSPSLHYVWIFTSGTFLNTKIEWTTEFTIVWTWNYDYNNTHRIFCRYLITNFIKELVIKILEMILRFYTYVIPSF